MDLTKILFLDIETVSGKVSYDELSDTFQGLWKLKADILYRNKEDIPEPSESYTEKAGIFAEFGKIVCISVGIIYIDKQDKEQHFKLKSFANDDEKVLLVEFRELLESGKGFKMLCGHNIREFDIPYICRRMVVNQIPLPSLLNISGKKPWDLEYLLDTMIMWRFGDFKNFTKLSLLTALFDIPTPKDDIDGSDVGRVYWQDNDLERIVVYCQKDVIAVAQLVLKFQGKELIPEDRIHD